MVYSPLMNAFRQTPEEAGGFGDLGKRISQGFKLAYEPRNLSEDLLSKMLENKINKPRAEHAEEITMADLANKYANTGATNSNTGLDSLRGKLMKAQINKANRPEALSGETAQLFALRNQYAPGTKEYDQVNRIIELKGSGTNGTSVSFDENGQPLVQIGGRGGRGLAGSTIQNPETGDTYSIPTGSTATNLQGRVIGSEQAAPYIERVISELPQFQGGVAQGKLFGESLSNALLGTHFKGPSKYALGHSAVKEASEGMVKAFGLNATGGNRQAMEDILKPQWGEDSEGYRNRVMQQASAYAENSNKAKGSLRGIKIKESDQYPSQKVNPVEMQKERQRDISTAKQFNTTPEKVLMARSQGVKTASEFREWLRSNP
jgi:hypothetical protein